MRLARRAIDAACVAMFVVVFAVFLYKIVMRYAVGDAVAWGDELTVVLFIWIVFIANAFLVPDERQICFDLIDRTCRPADGARPRSSGCC